MDSCFLVRYRTRSDGRRERTLVRKLIQHGFTLLVTRSILREVDRLLFRSKFAAVGSGTWGLLASHLTFLDDRRADIVSEAQRIPTHPPDNLHIAAAKLEGAAVLSYDRLLLRVAHAEGVEAYDPQQLHSRMSDSHA